MKSALSALSLLVALPAVALDLVRDGKPIATIVAAAPIEVAESAPAKGKAAPKRKPAPETDEQYAVRVLNEWVKKITDTELPIAGQAPVNGPAIFVGQAALAAGLKLDDIASLSREGVRIVADGKRVLIAGQSEAATLKAVCRFLEALGCRYLMADPLGEVFQIGRAHV